MSYGCNVLFDLHEDKYLLLFSVLFVSFLLTIIFLFVDFMLCYSHVSSFSQDWF